MAKPIVIVQFPAPAPSDLMHRALNYIEDVYRELTEGDIGSVDDIDHYAAGRFVVRVASSRHLGEVISVISKLLDRHKLKEHAVVSRADRGNQGPSQ